MARKDFRDVKAEFGVRLRWTNGYWDEGGNYTPYRFWLEDLNTGDRREISEAGLAYIGKHSTEEFRNGYRGVYKVYAELMAIENGDPIKESPAAKANKKWKEANQVMKSVAFHREHDADLLDWIAKTGKPFGTLVKDALREQMDLDIDE